MTNQNIYMYFTAIAIFAFVFLRVFDIYYVKKIGDSRSLKIKFLEQQVIELRLEVEKLRKFIDYLLSNISKENLAVSQDIVEDNSESGADTFNKYYRDVLLVCGERVFCDSDRRALRKAQIPFIRLLDATTESLKQEILRRRSDGNLYRIVHFAAHGNENYIELGMLPSGFKDKITGDELGLILAGVEVVFISSCKSTKVGDKVADIVPVVITLLEEVENNLAEAFATEFYMQIKLQASPQKAFYAAVGTIPEISEFAHIRVKN